MARASMQLKELPAWSIVAQPVNAKTAPAISNKLIRRIFVLSISIMQSGSMQIFSKRQVKNLWRLHAHLTKITGINPA
ncbi:MAG: hypothetical protein KA751_09860, partial [Comamonas sp.]|nr:hypothetical protein [Comamonas sp.]